ncbi:MAG: ribosome small subunit-dependent GTPase A [Eubacteriales bacterium]
MQQGIILKALSGFYYVDCDGEMITCRGRGKLRHAKTPPLVGDRVGFTLPEEGTEGALEEILPRKNFFHRPAVANIDQLVLVVSQAIPTTDPFLIDRITSIAASKGCDSLIVINKCDLATGDTLNTIYTNAGFRTLRVSAITGQGMEELSKELTGKVSAFTGNSGVGKSSLLNWLDPRFEIATGEISQKLGRGRHTTRHIEFFRLPNDVLIADTPGFSAFEEEKTTPLRKEELAQTFQEFIPYVEQCQFQDCAHIKEKGCAILEAMAEGKIEPTRHESYIRLYEQAKLIPDWARKT